MTLPTLPADKANHFVYGAAIYVASLVILPHLYALGVVVAVGAAKEAYDKISGTGTAELLDFVATAAGGVVGYVAGVL